MSSWHGSIVQAVAWRDFVCWALAEPEILLRYERDTGQKLLRHLLAAALENTDLSRPWLKDFIVWVTVNYWGEDDAPPQYFELIGKSHLEIVK